MLQIQSSSSEEQKFFLFILCLKSIGRYRLYLTDTDTTTRYHKNRPIPILKYWYMSRGKCLRGGDGRSGFIEEDRAKIWKEYMKKIINEENEWEHMVETDLVEGTVKKVVRDEIVEAMQSMKSGKATGPSEVNVETIVASGEVGMKVMMELCQRVLDGRGMPDEWKTSVIVPIFKEKSDVMSCESYR